MRLRQSQSRSNIGPKLSVPPYHTTPRARLEKSIFFTFPLDDIKYSTGPRMKMPNKFHFVKVSPNNRKELVFDPTNLINPNIQLPKINISAVKRLHSVKSHKSISYSSSISSKKSKHEPDDNSKKDFVDTNVKIKLGQKGSKPNPRLSLKPKPSLDDPPPIIPDSYENQQNAVTNPYSMYFTCTDSRPMTFSGDFECGNLGRVYRTGQNEYEISMLPDPSPHYSAHWYFFKVENIPPGNYTFTITGIFRNLNLHDIGVLPVALSLNDVKEKLSSPYKSKNGSIGWQRFGDGINFYCTGKSPSQYSLRFSFIVNDEPDIIYFAYLYPYTYTQLKNFLTTKLSLQFVPSILCQTPGKIDFPVIFWDANLQKCVDVNTIMRNSNRMASQRQADLMHLPSTAVKRRWFLSSSTDNKKPLIIIAARHHPGETCASYAMEGFMESLFCDDSEGALITSTKIDAKRLLEKFSFLILPMMNIDGVVCGYFRPALNGYDMNRSWIRPSSKLYPVEYHVIKLVDILVQKNPLLFFLDFHGHSSQCNAFTYGVWNDSIPLNTYEGVFPRLMSRTTDLFDDENSISFIKESYPTTMRVAFHNRYKIPFAYTLEMSYGGMNIGSRKYTQFSQGGYREIGLSVMKVLAEMLIDHLPIDGFLSNYYPPVNAPE